MQDIRIAAAMLQSSVGRLDENLAAVAAWTREARRAGARLICFPEMTLTGYSTRGILADLAVSSQGPVAKALQALAEQEAMTILVGTAEPAPGDRVYAVHWVVRPGKPIAAYRKTHIAPPEDRVLAPGDRVPLFDDRAMRFGIQLCYDAHFPELSAYMAARGADVIFFPHASPRGTPIDKRRSWLRHLTARAFDNGVFVVACNQAGENGEGLTFPATAVVIGPSGDLLAQDTSGAEGLLLADLEASRLAHVRGHRMRYFLPRRRTGLYRRLLDGQASLGSEADEI
ncbi:MAG: nitrilase-related carbon-nitrogen hydrolase [Desulfobacterales bacterium]|jgi:N-carbamoylputrescine amidase